MLFSNIVKIIAVFRTNYSTSPSVNKTFPTNQPKIDFLSGVVFNYGMIFLQFSSINNSAKQNSVRMFKREYFLSYIKWGLISAVAFCIPMIIFVNSQNYQNTWWLFVGNGLFLVVIAAYMLSFNKMKGGDASTQTQMAAGHIATLVGIIFSCIISAIAISVFIPDVFRSDLSDKALDNAPAQTGTGKTHGLLFFVFMCAIVGNLCGGSFSSIMLPYTAKRNQTKDRKSEVLNN
jgi:hypothetical protein